MTPLYLWNGKILQIDGALAGDQACCCTPTPTPTPTEPYDPYGVDLNLPEEE